MIDERLLPSESEAQIDENFNRVLTLVDNINHVVIFPQGPANEVFNTMTFAEACQLATDILNGNAHAIMQVDASGAGLGEYSLPVIAYVASVDPIEALFQVSTASESTDLAVCVQWSVSCASPPSIVFTAYMLHSDLSEWANVSTIFGLFPTTLAIYYHPMN